MQNRFVQFISTLLLFTCLSGCVSNFDNCSNNWKITGYFTPIESDFSSQDQTVIRVKKLAKLKFSKSFIESVKIEGWGKTRFGWYLGFYSQQWHASDAPLDSTGKALTIGTVAVDNHLISSGQSISIPDLKNLLDVKVFVASDVGSQIKGKHIDIYTGEGKDSKNLTYKISGYHRICSN